VRLSDAKLGSYLSLIEVRAALDADAAGQAFKLGDCPPSFVML
jgi:hypothetical protein